MIAFSHGPEWDGLDVLDEEAEDMTVCIAAICESPIRSGGLISPSFVICASDRMLTSGDIQYEPPSRKIHTLTRAIFILEAGNSSVQTQIIDQVQGIVQPRVAQEPNNWWTVKEVADLYHQYYHQLKAHRAESEILWPLQMDIKSFGEKQKQMSSAEVKRITKKLRNYSIEPVGVIIAGLDPSGPHIYTITNGDFTCNDREGFSAIGKGRSHAESQFMFNGHSPGQSFAKTLYLVYSAKRLASDVAPGVGEETDMAIIGPAPGYCIPEVNSNVIENLDGIYKETRDKINLATNEANAKAKEYYDLLTKTKEGQAHQAPPEPESGGGIDEKRDRDDAGTDGNG